MPRPPETNEAARGATQTASMNPHHYEGTFPMNMPAKREDFNGIDIVARNGVLMTSSIGVAERFGKRHADVLRAIAELDCSREFIERNFAFSTYRPEGAKRDYPYVEMTRDGFTFLAMGFTGKEAAQWKEGYISAFNAMEAHIRTQSQVAQIDLHDPAQLVPLLTSYAQRTQVAEAKVIELQPKAEAFDVLDASEGSVNVRVAAKVLGAAEKKFIKWLEARRWAFRQNGVGPLQAYAEKRIAGYLDHKPHTFLDHKTGENRTTAQMVFTPKGLARLAEIFAKEGVPA